MPAFGQTRLQIINAVLPRMRESTVATASSTTYALMVANVLNTIRSQIESAWQWRNLRDTYIVTVLPGTTSYSLVSSGQFAQIIDVWNTTNNSEVLRGTTRGFNTKFFGTDTIATGDVSQYNPVGLDANYDVQIDTWPDVTATNSLSVNLYIPQADPPLDTTVILVPNQVLIEGMVAYLIAERGDDSGTAAQMQFSIYQQMLADAIAVDVSHDPTEADWYPV